MSLILAQYTSWQYTWRRYATDNPNRTTDIELAEQVHATRNRVAIQVAAQHLDIGSWCRSGLIFATESPGKMYACTVGRYLPLTRHPNGIPSTVTGAQYQRPLCARTYKTESTYNIQCISCFFSFFFPFFSLSSSAKFIRLFVIWVSRPLKTCSTT